MDSSERCVNKYFSYFWSVHQRSCTVGGPRTLCLFVNWASCLKRLRTPGLLISGNQKIREVMAAQLLCRYKHLCTLLFRVVTSLYLKKYICCMQQATKINWILWSQWSKECFIVHFTFQQWFISLRIYRRLETLTQGTSGRGQMPSRVPPRCDISWNAYWSVTTRASTATRAGCVQRDMGKGTPGVRRGSRDAAPEDDPRPNIIQLNTEGSTANKISVIEQLACKNKAFIIVLLRNSNKFI